MGQIQHIQISHQDECPHIEKLTNSVYKNCIKTHQSEQRPRNSSQIKCKAPLIPQLSKSLVLIKQCNLFLMTLFASKTGIKKKKKKGPLYYPPPTPYILIDPPFMISSQL